MRVSKWVGSVCIALLAAGTLPAEDKYIRGEEDGRQLFLANCVVCHGPDGDSVSAADLGHGKFRRASSDDDLVQIIRTGIPGTPMPPNDLSKFETGAIVAYLRFLASTARSTSASGDAARGRAVFESRGGCLNCHRVRDKGSRMGPDLTEIGSLRRSVELERSVLEPDAEILPSNRFVRVVKRDGATITGRLLNRDGFSVQLIDSRQRLLSLQLSNLKECVFLDRSLMPSYQDKLSREEVADLVSYLVSLKGIDTQ
jgi:putative heme-binding domain-containing protein